MNHKSDIDAYFMEKGIAYEDELQQIMEVTDWQRDEEDGSEDGCRYKFLISGKLGKGEK